MATKIWKIEKDLCRCCHAEGAFDNLAEPRTFLEKEEVYSDMLKECLDIDIPPVPGELCSITYTICNDCIVRLRDACNFKKQVQDCEQRFMTLYYKNAIQGIKPETKVKEELEVTIVETQSDAEQDIVFKKEDEDDDDDHLMGGDDDDMSDDDIPIKQSLLVMKTRPKPKPKPKAPPVKKEKPPPKQKKKEVPKKKEPAKEKKGTVIYGDFTRTRDADGTEGFCCNVCKNVYKKRTSFSQHYKHVHLQQRPKLRGCHLCDVKVPGHMRAFHMETHGLPAPSCGACGKKFAFPWQVLQHQKFFHMGEKEFRCEMCNLAFEYKRQLDHHSIKHTQLKPFKCDVCGKCFRWRNNLKKHMMIHLNIRPHVCSVCQEAFVQSSSLSYHMKTKHPEAHNASVLG